LGTIIVAGAIANKVFNGGEAWVRLNWILGLRKLGFDVHFIEEISPENCVDLYGGRASFEDSINRAYFEEVADRFGLSDSATLVYSGGEQVHGAAWTDLLELAAAADLLVNISGHLRLQALLARIRRKVYIDIDPGFTQFWHADPGIDFRLAGHDFYYSIAENLGRSGCTIPVGEIPWRHVRPPLVLEEWPIARSAESDRFTTIANWRGPYGPVRFEGRTFGLKVHEFRKLIDLPRRVAQSFEIALKIDPADDADLCALREHDWEIVDPLLASGTPDAFRRYVQGSGAEFSVAQGIYVDTRSGWFSDRTVAYLASGKPALVQDSGWGRNYPVGEGLLSFRSLEEAIGGAEIIARDYAGHCQAARALAEEYFAADRVLEAFIGEVGVA